MSKYFFYGVSYKFLLSGVLAFCYRVLCVLGRVKLVESLDTNGRAHADSLLLACLASPPALLGICICMGFGNAINMRAGTAVAVASVGSLRPRLRLGANSHLLHRVRVWYVW